MKRGQFFYFRHIWVLRVSRKFPGHDLMGYDKDESQSVSPVKCVLYFIFSSEFCMTWFWGCREHYLFENLNKEQTFHNGSLTFYRLDPAFSFFCSILRLPDLQSENKTKQSVANWHQNLREWRDAIKWRRWGGARYFITLTWYSRTSTSRVSSRSWEWRMRPR